MAEPPNVASTLALCEVATVNRSLMPPSDDTRRIRVAFVAIAVLTFPTGTWTRRSQKMGMP